MPRCLHSNLAYYRQNKACFGGNIYKGHAKQKRPFYANQGLHIVLRSSLAKGRRSMLEDKNREKIKWLIRKQAKRFGVELNRFANSGNHLHLLVKPRGKRADFHAFIRAISGLIARIVLNAERGKPRGLKFWDARPFTRIAALGAEFARCAHYIEKNILEALGFEGLNRELDEFFRWQKSAYS